MSGAQRGGDGRWVVDPAGEFERLAAGRVASRRVGVVGELDRQACEQADPQRGVVVADHGQPLLQACIYLGIGAEDRHPGASHPQS